jgi:hypothetical protein
MTYDNSNRGAVWKNRDKTEDRHPDFKGSLNVEGREFWVSAWKRKDGDASNKPALSFSIKLKEEKQEAAKPTATKQSAARDEDMDDEIPF